MPVVAPVALGLLLVWGIHLLQLEWKRFKADRAPGPPPTPEEAALDRWSAGVVMLVAGLSVVGAVLAFWASGQFSSASSLSQQAVQEVTEYQTVSAEQEGYFDFGSRLTETLQEGTMAESSLYAQAAVAWDDDEPAEAQALEARARVAGAQERALAFGFLCYGPLFEPYGVVNFDPSAQRALEVEKPCVQQGQDQTALRTLSVTQANALVNSAANHRGKAQEIVLAGAFVILAVFFLTLTYLGRRHRRVGPLGLGVAAVAVSLGVALLAALS